MEIVGLSAATYLLLLRQEGKVIRVVVASGISFIAGSQEATFVCGNKRALQLSDPRNYLQISDVRESESESEKVLEITLSNFSSSARVHVISTTFSPLYKVSDLAQDQREPLVQDLGNYTFPVLYTSSGELNSEHNYILNRKYANKFCGNMLPVPTLLLHPRQVKEDTHLSTQFSAYGAPAPMYACGMGYGEPMMMEKCAMDMDMDMAGGRGRPVKFYTSNLDFLATGAIVLSNLVPSVGGKVFVPLKSLSGSHIRVVAVDGPGLVVSEYFLPYKKIGVLDLRMSPSRALEPEGHFTEQQLVTTSFPGEKFTIRDLSTARFRIYDTLSDIYHLLCVLSESSRNVLSKFEFVLKWNDFSEEVKFAKYSEFQCHELNFFLFKKDKEFFDRHVITHLRNKIHPSFMDIWLMGDLSELKKFREIRKFSQLNVCEKILLGERLEEGLVERVSDWVKISLNAVEENRVLFNYLFKTSLKGRKIEGDFPTSGGVSRGEPPSFYTEVEPGKQWAETGYYNLQKSQQGSGLVPVNKFWRDYASHACGERKEPFISQNFIYAYASFTEVMFVISLLDLPFVSSHNVPQYADGSLVLQTESPVVVFHKELRETETVSGPILLSQHYFDPKEPTMVDSLGETVDKHITSEFIQYKPYATQVIITNVSQSEQKLEILRQIPVGALPLSNGFFTECMYVQIPSSSTQILNNFWYFPEVGSYHHFPVHISKNQKVVAFTPPTTLNVVSRCSTIDTKSWNYISQNSSTSELLAYLESSNLQDEKVVDLDQLAWRLCDKDLYLSVITLLRRRCLFNKKLWSYSLFHKDVETAREFLETLGAFSSIIKDLFHSSLYRVEQSECYEYQEFFPHVNARAHLFGSCTSEVFDKPSMKAQYSQFLENLFLKQHKDCRDFLMGCYYMLLQSRVEDAKALFQKVSPDSLGSSSQVQYHYLEAYLDFFNSFPTRAKEISEKYLDYPVVQWRNRFRAIKKQLDEICGEEEEEEAGSALSREQKLTLMTKRQSSIDFVVEKGVVHLTYTNLSECIVSFFQMDVELLFSLNPFAIEQLDQFSVVQPIRSIRVHLPSPGKDGRGGHDVVIPQELENTNLVVVVTGGGCQKSHIYYTHSLSVHFFVGAGQLKIMARDTGKPLSSVYVKVFAGSKEDSVFHKDGYTDQRGRFDYLSRSDAPSRQSFSILIVSETHGTLITSPK
eukprot:TRINITY_DN6520_c0_g1_i13.p1 TRINITY_DN6520_c0_g1~~TRINITY_DN6520_c0_g1_i13.p1  ORF type:complete len:1192 (-),score=285.06 TRINITY_DN6520_c0_g1_i13:75-3650(-)